MFRYKLGSLTGFGTPFLGNVNINRRLRTLYNRREDSRQFLNELHKRCFSVMYLRFSAQIQSVIRRHFILGGSANQVLVFGSASATSRRFLAPTPETSPQLEVACRICNSIIFAQNGRGCGVSSHSCNVLNYIFCALGMQ